jgi:AraC-like DNA-binding protein
MCPINPAVNLSTHDEAVLRLARACSRIVGELSLVPAAEVPSLLRDVAGHIPQRASALGGVVIHHMVQRLILRVRELTPDWDPQWDSQLVSRLSYTGGTAATKRLLWQVISLLAAARPLAATERPALSDRRVTAALEAVRTYYGDGTFDLKSAASHVKLSPSYLDRLLARHTGHSFVHHLRATRLDAAQQLLNSSLFSIKEVAAKVGYNSVTHLERSFRAHLGCSPSEWRRQNGTR